MATKILVVDDEADYCEMIKEKLSATGEFEVTVLTDATKAEATVNQMKPDLVLLDNVMPGVMGSEIAKKLRQKGSETRGIPIIMVSGKGEFVYTKKGDEFKWMPNSPIVKNRGTLPDAKGAEALAQAYGVNDYVAKPFKIEVLIEVVKDVLARTRKVEEDKKDEEPLI